MSLIVSFEDFENTVRVTKDGLCSVYDVMKVAGMTQPGRSWGRMCQKFPELKDRVEFHKFPGRGQRETPVANGQSSPNRRSLSSPQHRQHPHRSL